MRGLFKQREGDRSRPNQSFCQPSGPRVCLTLQTHADGLAMLLDIFGRNSHTTLDGVLLTSTGGLIYFVGLLILQKL